VLRDRQGRRGKMKQSRGTKTIVRGLVPFVSENVLHQGGTFAGKGLGNIGVAPKAQGGHRIRDGNGVGAPRIHGPNLTNQCVLRPSSVRRRTKSWIAPATRP